MRVGIVDRTSWRVIVIAYSTGVLAAAQVGRVAPAGTALVAEFDIGLTVLGWMVSLITFASAIGGLGAGLIIQRTGARRMLVTGTMLLAVSVLLSALAPTVSVLLSMRILEGVGYLFVTVAAPTLIAHSAASRDMAPALALWGTFFTCGISLAAFAGGWMSDILGWRVWTGLNGFAIAAILPAILRYVPASPIAVERAAKARFDWSLPRAIWILGFAFWGVTFTALTILSMMPSFLKEMREFAPSTIGSITGFVAMSSILGSLVYSFSTKRLRANTVVLLTVAVTALAIFPAFSADTPQMRGVMFTALAVAGTGVLIAHVFASVPRMAGRNTRIGPANGLVAQIGSIGSLLGPPVIGGFVTMAGWTALPLLVALSALVFLALAYLAERHHAADEMPKAVI